MGFKSTKGLFKVAKGAIYLCIKQKVTQAHPLVVPPHPQVPFQQVPQISIVAQSTSIMEPSIFQNIVFRVVDRLVQCPWKQNPPVKA